MQTFRDATGREWSVNISVQTVKRVEAACRVRLDRLIENECSLVSRLLEDPAFLCDVLFSVCGAEAAERKVTSEDFAAAMAGDALTAGFDALLEAVADFLPGEERRKAVRDLHGKFKSAAVELWSSLAEAVASIDPAKIVSDAAERAESESSAG